MTEPTMAALARKRPRSRPAIAALAALAAAAACLGAAPAGAQEPPPPFAWSSMSRYAGMPEPAGPLIGVPRRVPADVDRYAVLVEPAAELCEAGAGVRWRVDGESFDPVPLPPKTGRRRAGECPFAVPFDRQGAHRIEVAAGSAPPVSVSVRVQDQLVVALGDSVGSGEGNPVGGGSEREPKWLEPRCHRSVAAGFEQAARLIGASTPADRSLTFVNLACSGSTVPTGLLGEYGGIDPPPGGSRLPAQLARLRSLRERRPVDAVLVSVGANDVFFGDVVQHCIAAVRCQEAKFGKDGETADAAVGAALDRLGGRYDDLDGALRALPGGRPPVLITEYFDPTHDAKGGPCSRTRGLPGVTEAEMQWASEAVLTPLNLEALAAARRHHWRYVGGIADDFRLHGYCAAQPNRWVRTVTESLATQLGSAALSGTLHPNERGHAAIARRVAPDLAGVLGLEVPPPAGGGGSGTVSDVAKVSAIAALVLVLLAAIALFAWLLSQGLNVLVALLVELVIVVMAVVFVLGAIGYGLARWGRRVGLLFAGGRAPVAPEGEREHARLADVHLPASLGTLGAKVGGLLVTAVVSVSFVALVGGVVMWVRFWALRIPPFEGLAAVDRTDLIAVGAQALLGFVVFAAIALVVVWGFDAKGRAVRSTRRGLALLVVAELVVALAVEHVPVRLAALLTAGLASAALLGAYLVERSVALGSVRTPGDLVARGRRLVARAAPGDEPEAGPPADRLLRLAAVAVLALAIAGVWAAESTIDQVLLGIAAILLLVGILRAGLLARWLRWLVRLVPLLLLAFALVMASRADNEIDRALFAFLPILLAAVAFVAPLGIGALAEDRQADGLDAPRIALAATTLSCIAILIARDEAWLAATACIALVLAGLCLLVAALSDERFAPYGLAVVMAVPVFGAGLAVVRAISSPQAQPAAAVSADGSRAVCGVFVGERDDKFWIAHVELSEQGARRRPRPRLARLATIPDDEVAVSVVGPMQPVARAQEQSLALRDELLRGRGMAPGDSEKPAPCTADAPPPPVVDSPERKLAESVQPSLVLDRLDGFWPVPVRTLFSMQDRRSRICRRLSPELCIGLRTQGAFPWSGGQGESIEYPAADNHVDDQHALMVDALGSVDPARTARAYYLVTGGDSPQAPIGVQFWFFYTFNYQPLNGAPRAGFHEGDFESVGVLLSARTHRPRYVWMARHDAEGRVFAWEEDVLEKAGDHARVFVARGSHASYESCDRQSRPQGPGGLIDDRPSCEESRQWQLGAGAVPLTDLSRVPWACWQGLFGHRRVRGTQSLIAYHVADAPRSPLRQQAFDGIDATPCADIRDPGGREGRGEEVLPDAVSAQLRAGAGRLERLVDECGDWSRPPVRGAYLVACDPMALRRNLTTGLEEVDPAGVRIDVTDDEQPKTGPVTVPAVRRDARSARLDTWRIVTGAADTTVEVFASCQTGNRMLAATFPHVRLPVGTPVRVDDRPRERWRLRTEDGTTIAEARPALVQSGSEPARDQDADVLEAAKAKPRACGGVHPAHPSVVSRVRDFLDRLLPE